MQKGGAMSHVVTIKTQVRDATAVAAACKRLGLPAPVHKTVKLFSDTKTGLTVQLPKWKYPLVCDVNSGAVHFDNYGGAWGDQSQLDAFMQAYSVEKARLEARKQGHRVTEEALPSGEIKLTIHVQEGGAA
jgi:hypothetical protein